MFRNRTLFRRLASAGLLSAVLLTSMPAARAAGTEESFTFSSLFLAVLEELAATDPAVTTPEQEPEPPDTPAPAPEAPAPSTEPSVPSEDQEAPAPETEPKEETPPAQESSGTTNKFVQVWIDCTLPPLATLYADRDLIDRTEEQMPDLVQPAPKPAGSSGSGSSDSDSDSDDEEERSYHTSIGEVATSAGGRTPSVSVEVLPQETETEPETPAVQPPAQAEQPAVQQPAAQQPAVQPAAPVQQESEPAVPTEVLTDTQTIISGARLSHLMEMNPDSVLFEKQGVALSIPTAFLRSLGIGDNELLAVTIQSRTDGFTFMLTANGVDVTGLPETLVRFPGPAGAGTYTLQLDGSGEALAVQTDSTSGLLSAGITHTGSYTLVPVETTAAPADTAGSKADPAPLAQVQTTQPTTSAPFPVAEAGIAIGIGLIGAFLWLWRRRRASDAS